MADSDVIDAMTQSGYPLQTIVGERLRTDFLFVQDEWGFVDRDTVSARARPRRAQIVVGPRATEDSTVG